VVGVHAAAAVLTTGSRKVYRAYVLVSAEHERGGDGTGASLLSSVLLPALSAQRIHVLRADRNTLDRVSRGAVHQGIVLDVSPLRARPLPAGFGVEDLPPSRTPSSPPLLVALDEVVDPHNVGAVMRSALLLGADGIILSARNSAPLGATVAKTSSGALEAWSASGRLFDAEPNMPALLTACAASGWTVLGAAAPPEEGEGELGGAAAGVTAGGPTWVPSHQLRRTGPTVLVLGSEGKGMRTTVKRACTVLCYIPMQHAEMMMTTAKAPDDDASSGPSQPPQQTGTSGPKLRRPIPIVESLNVSAAAAILLHELRPR
jgi:21S rRNA (GM2251-2'-O)-methyltransferase